jgi:hypothetical protein
MISSIFENIDVFLPKYLSDTSKDALKRDLEAFPSDGTKASIYTSMLKNADYLLQGDGVANVPMIMFPNTEVKTAPVMLFTNTCDLSLENKRIYPSRIVYAPILKLESYKQMLLKNGIPADRVETHISDIKKQWITQVLYLPKGTPGVGLQYEGIVFFDRVISLPMSKETVENLVSQRIFSLSDFGFYLFLFKYSVHYTRIQERIDRNIGKDLGAERN